MKVRFKEGEMVFHRIKIRTKKANVAEIDKREFRRVIRTPLNSAVRSGVLEKFEVPFQGRDPEPLLK